MINVSEVQVLRNPASFHEPLAFDIQYECVSELEADLEWKMIYVGSAESEEYDQVLDSILVGPVYAGNYRFVFEANPPDTTRLHPDDIVGVTVILLTCSYKGKEFIRIGYYVNHEYVEEELRAEPPKAPVIDKLSRSILADHPRVTRFPNDFDSPPIEEPVVEESQQGMQIEQGDQMGMSPEAGEQQTGLGMPDSSMMMMEDAPSLEPGMMQQQSGGFYSGGDQGLMI